jgi:hypothetical protein
MGQPVASQGKPETVGTATTQPTGKIHEIKPGEATVKGEARVVARGTGWNNDALGELQAERREGEATKAELASLKADLRRLAGDLSPAVPSAGQPSASQLPRPPALERGLNAERDEFARKILRERGWGQAPRPEEFWILTTGQVKQLWRLSGEVAKDCPVQDPLTGDDVRRKAVRAAFKRVTGS